MVAAYNLGYVIISIVSSAQKYFAAVAYI